jgi:hypothetical protein
VPSAINCSRQNLSAIGVPLLGGVAYSSESAELGKYCDANRPLERVPAWIFVERQRDLLLDLLHLCDEFFQLHSSQRAFGW